MELLYLLESIRTPFLDTVVSAMTHFGDESVFLVIGLIIFWCIDKYEGYYLMSVGFLGTALNQILKVAFRVPRPWVIDGEFSIVESARARATGYSFPSGHTQFAVGAFGGVAKWEQNNIVRILCIAVCFIVPFSRMYLGVHTPLDVSVGAACALVLVFGLYPVMKKAKDNKKIIPIFLAVFLLILTLGLLYMYLWEFPQNIDMVNLMSGRENLWKLSGAALGMLCGYLIDTKYVRFETKAPLAIQIIKVALGMLIVLAIKSGLKPILSGIFGDLLIKDAIRYFIVVLVPCGIWPMTFKVFSKLVKK